jgi:hypothetical protein
MQIKQSTRNKFGNFYPEGHEAHYTGPAWYKALVFLPELNGHYKPHRSYYPSREAATSEVISLYPNATKIIIHNGY